MGVVINGYLVGVVVMFELVCFVIVGFVDDGKFMLIGCLFYDMKLIFED